MPNTYADAAARYAADAADSDTAYAAWAADAAARYAARGMAMGIVDTFNAAAAHNAANAATVAMIDDGLRASAARSDRRNAAAMRSALDAAAVNAAARPMPSAAAARYAAARYAYATSDHGRSAWSIYVGAADAARSL